MTDFTQRDDFAMTARVLGALFYYAPDSTEAAPLVSALTADDWQTQWPLAAETLSPLATDFTRVSMSHFPRHSSACSWDPTRYRRRPGDRSG